MSGLYRIRYKSSFSHSAGAIEYLRAQPVFVSSAEISKAQRAPARVSCFPISSAANVRRRNGNAARKAIIRPSWNLNATDFDTPPDTAEQAASQSRGPLANAAERLVHFSESALYAALNLSSLRRGPRKIYANGCLTNSKIFFPASTSAEPTLSAAKPGTTAIKSSA